MIPLYHYHCTTIPLPLYHCILVGEVLGIEALKERVDRSSLQSIPVATSRSGVKNVSSKKQEDDQLYSPLKEGEEAHWEVRPMA